MDEEYLFTVKVWHVVMQNARRSGTIGDKVNTSDGIVLIIMLNYPISEIDYLCKFDSKTVLLLSGRTEILPAKL